MLFRSATSRNIFSVAACGVITTVAAAGVLFSMAYGDLRSGSLAQMRDISMSNAAKIEKTMAKGLQLVVGMQTSLSMLKGTGNTDRSIADVLLKKTLEDNTMALGAWTGWDPNAFDGKDKDFVGKPGHDATGRYVPYWVKSGGTIIHQALTDYTVPGAGDYYILAHDRQKPVVVEPYPYAIDGVQTLITSIVVPMMIDGKAVGVAGIDMSLADINTALAAIKPMNTGYMGLMTSTGNIISHPDAALIGKNLKDAGSAVSTWSQLIAHPGVEQEVTGADGQQYFSVANPVALTSDENWFAIVTVPKSTVFAQLDKMVWSSVVIVALAALLLGLAGWLIARKFIGRIANVIRETEEIAKGNLNVALQDLERKDEIGDLSRSLGILLESNRQKVQLERQAEAGRAAAEAERAERSRINAAQEEDVKFVVGELAGGLAKLAAGDVTVRLDHVFCPALDETRVNFNNAIEKLQAAMVSFSDNAAAIQSGSEEIRVAADNLARRTEQQAASVEETAAALEEITTSVKDSTARAEEAGSLVGRTKQGAEKSGEVVRDAVDAMSAIEQSSQSISNIIGVIDDIAFQTNLLALNAGVEAARAGEAGKGFAVVAQEVRELAQRSATAAKEIKNLITSSGEQVRRGVSLVGQTGAALQTIVAEVQEINRNVEAIVQAAREQSTGLQEINSAVNQMDQATQQNAAMVEESNAASHTLVSEVTALSSRLGQFNLGNMPASRAAAHTLAHQASMARPSQPAQRPLAQPAARARTPLAVASQSRPAPSPARALGNKLAAALSAAPAAAAPSGGDWEEF